MTASGLGDSAIPPSANLSLSSALSQLPFGVAPRSRRREVAPVASSSASPPPAPRNSSILPCFGLTSASSGRLSPTSRHGPLPHGQSMAPSTASFVLMDSLHGFMASSRPHWPRSDTTVLP